MEIFFFIGRQSWRERAEELEIELGSIRIEGFCFFFRVGGKVQENFGKVSLLFIFGYFLGNFEYYIYCVLRMIGQGNKLELVEVNVQGNGIEIVVLDFYSLSMVFSNLEGFCVLLVDIEVFKRIREYKRVAENVLLLQRGFGFQQLL